eukprot:m.129205 g.129205  ORF g.129205 m.129205 type:complete len:513 (+) comp29381_c0_seq1:315-1853(+)
MDDIKVVVRPPRSARAPIRQVAVDAMEELAIAGMGIMHGNTEDSKPLLNDKQRKEECPPGTVRYTVTPNDSITHLSIKFDMSQQEIAALNRMATASIFPGQVILVKDPHQANLYIPRSLPKKKKADPEPFVLVSPNPKTIPTLVDARSGQDVEFANTTMFRVKALYLTGNKGLVPGVIEGSCDYMRFTPSPTSASVIEFGRDAFSLYFEYEDLLEPNTTRESPDPNSPARIGPGYASHRDQAQVIDETSTTSLPIFLQIRVRLLFGAEPTPETIATYWFGIAPRWIDRVYAVLQNAASVQQSESWHFIQSQPVSRETSGGRPLMASPPIEVEETPLRGETELLTHRIVQAIKKSLPARQKYSDWVLGFSTYQHGLSLSNLYRTLAPRQSSACITIIRDTKGGMFGCYTTESWKALKPGLQQYYGGGESFVFKIAPEQEFYKWTGCNKLFMLSTMTELMIGGGAGQAAIWLDNDLVRGCSRPTKTFNNNCLASSHDFTINGLEVWILESPDDD